MDWAMGIAGGMNYLHLHKIIHRDLKSPKWVVVYLSSKSSPEWINAKSDVIINSDKPSGFFYNPQETADEKLRRYR